MIPPRNNETSLKAYWLTHVRHDESSSPASKIQKINSDSSPTPTLSQDQMDLRQQVSAIKVRLIDMSWFFSEIIETSEPGVFDFRDSERFKQCMDQSKVAITQAKEFQNRFKANPANQFSSEIPIFDCWLRFLQDVTKMAITQNIPGSDVARLFGSLIGSSEFEFSVDRWVKGNKKIYKIPDPFLTYYYYLLITAKPSDFRLKVLESLVKQRYTEQTEFSLTFSGPEIFVLNKCTIAQIPHKTALGQSTEDLPEVGEFILFHQEPMSKAALEHLKKLEVLLKNLFTSLNAEIATFQRDDVRKQYTALISSLTGNQLKELNFTQTLAEIDPVSPFVYNGKYKIQTSSDFYPVAIVLKVLMMNADVKGFREFFLKKFEEWLKDLYNDEDIQVLQSYQVIVSCDEQQFILTLGDYLAGSEQMGSEHTLISYCIHDSLDKAGIINLPKPKGIPNPGNNCYLNSVIQALFSLDSAVKTFSPTFQPALDIKSAKWRQQLEDLHKSIKNVFITYNSSEKMPPLDDYRNHIFAMGLAALSQETLLGQQDAVDVAAVIMEAAGLTFSLQPTIIGATSFKKYESKLTPEPMQLIPIPVIQENEDAETPAELMSLLGGFMNAKTNSWENFWSPEPGVELSIFTEERKIVNQIPKVIGLHLKRFDKNAERISRQIIFPADDVLDMTPYIEKGLIPEGEKAMYRLKSLVVHQGRKSLRFGHYVALVKRGDEWYEINDNNVKKIPSNQVNRGEAYLIFFERC